MFIITLRILSCLFLVNLSQNALAFSIPEKLEYDLTWTGIKAGNAVLEVKDNGAHIEIISRANSAKWVSVFYHVEDVVTSTLKKEQDNGIFKGFAGIPYNYRLKLKEGKHVRDKEVMFDQKTKKIIYTNHIDKKSSEFNINEEVFDPLSSFYYVRGIPLSVGQSVFVNVFDSKKMYNLEVQVLKKESVETPLGTFKTILIKPVMKSEGIFKKKGDIFIWLSDDEKKIPVLLKTTAPVGSIKATLVGGQF